MPNKLCSHLKEVQFHLNYANETSSNPTNIPILAVCSVLGRRWQGAVVQDGYCITPPVYHYAFSGEKLLQNDARAI